MRKAFRRIAWPRVLVLAVVLILVAARWVQERQELGDPPTPTPGAQYYVDRVVDGDTLLLQGGARVRLIGIDTPETKKPNHAVEPWGAEATRYADRFVADAGNSVRLEFDLERVDRFGRLLAYVYFGERFLNEELVHEGLATVSGFRFSQSVRRKFLKAEDSARAARRGIWSTEPAATLDAVPRRVN